MSTPPKTDEPVPVTDTLKATLTLPTTTLVINKRDHFKKSKLIESLNNFTKELEDKVIKKLKESMSNTEVFEVKIICNFSKTESIFVTNPNSMDAVQLQEDDTSNNKHITLQCYCGGNGDG